MPRRRGGFRPFQEPPEAKDALDLVREGGEGDRDGYGDRGCSTYPGSTSWSVGDVPGDGPGPMDSAMYLIPPIV